MFSERYDDDSNTISEATRQRRCKRIKRALSALVSLIILVAVLSIWQYTITKRSNPVPPRGSLNIATIGRISSSDVTCELKFDTERSNIWECKAGLLPPTDKGRDKLPHGSPDKSATLVIFVEGIESSVEMTGRQTDETTEPHLDYQTKTGRYQPGAGEGVPWHEYSAVALHVADISACQGFVVVDKSLMEANGLFRENNCEVSFRITMPKSSVGVSSNQVSSISLPLNTVTSDGGQNEVSGADAYWIARDLDFSTHVKDSLEFSLQFAFNKFQLRAVGTPLNWIPTSISPQPSSISPSYIRPIRETNGSSPTGFQAFVAGSVPSTKTGLLSYALVAAIGFVSGILMEAFLGLINSFRSH